MREQTGKRSERPQFLTALQFGPLYGTVIKKVVVGQRSGEPGFGSIYFSLRRDRPMFELETVPL